MPKAADVFPLPSPVKISTSPFDSTHVIYKEKNEGSRKFDSNDVLFYILGELYLFMVSWLN